MAKSRNNLDNWREDYTKKMRGNDNSVPTRLLVAFFAQMATTNVMEQEKLYDRYKHSYIALVRDIEVGITRFDIESPLYEQWEYLTRNMTLCNLYIGAHLRSEPSHYICLKRGAKGWQITSDRINSVPPGIFTPPRPGIFVSWGDYTPTAAKALRVEPRLDVVFTGSEKALSGYANEAIHDYEVRRQLSFAALQQAAIGTADPNIIHTYHNPGRVTLECEQSATGADGIFSPYTFRTKVIRPGADMGQSKYLLTFTTATDHNCTYDPYPDGRLLLPVTREGIPALIRNGPMISTADAILSSLILPFVGLTENKQTTIYGPHYDPRGILGPAEYIPPRSSRYAAGLPCLIEEGNRYLTPNAVFLHMVREALLDNSPNERLKLWRRNLLVTQALREIQGFQKLQKLGEIVDALEKLGFPLSPEDKEKLG